MPDRTLDTVLEPPAAQPAPDTLHTTISRLADRQSTRRHTVTWRHVVAPVAAASALTVGIAGAAQLREHTRPAQVAGPSAPTTAPQHPTVTSGALAALTSAQVAAQRTHCLTDAQQSRATWRTAYAQRVSVLGTSKLSSILVLDSGRAYVTCVNGAQTGWALHGEGSKIVPRTPSAETPAVVTDGVFNVTTPYARGKTLVQFAARVDDSVTGGRVRIVTPDGAEAWSTVPATQGWLIMQIVVPTTGRHETKPTKDTPMVEFQATDQAGAPLTIADSDGQHVTTVRIPALA